MMNSIPANLGLITLVALVASSCHRPSQLGAAAGGGGDAGAGGSSHHPHPDAGADSGPPDASTGAGGQGTSGGLPPLPSPLYGVTVDDISSLSEITTALSALPHKPTTRIVFDAGQQPSYYTQAVAAISAVSYVMGEILDSAFVSTVSVSEYTQRTSNYLAAFPQGVDLWEVGNEINGDWLGATADVAAKMTGAFDLVKANGGRTALTLYGCSDSGASHDMFNWVDAQVPARMLTGLDYVLVSYYEGDCGAPRALSGWSSVFQELHQRFPNAGLGFGEIGAVDQNGNDLDDLSVSGPYLHKYYARHLSVPNYVGGYFWWYFREDMVPKTKPLFAALYTAIQ